MVTNTKTDKSAISKSAVVKIAKKNGAERIGKDAAVKLVEFAENYVADLPKKLLAQQLMQTANRSVQKTLSL